MIENIRLGKKEEALLYKLRRSYGISNWNILCRAAFCNSMSRPDEPVEYELKSDSSIEMTWKTFGGPRSEIYYALLVERYKDSSNSSVMNSESYYHHFRLHLTRGLTALLDYGSLRDWFIEACIQE